MIQKTKVLIAGCGYLGRSIGAELAAQGALVWGLCRSEASLAKVRSAGIEPFRADMADPSRLQQIPPVDAVVACQAPARGETYTAAYLEATQNLLRAVRTAAVPASAAKPLRFILVSSTSVYGPRNGGWVEADTLIDPGLLDEDARALFQTERAVLAAGTPERPIEGMVLRLSGIYGPERSRADALRSGRMRPSASDAYTNRIHREDAAAAVIRLLEMGTAGQVYLASDDLPSTQTEFYGWLCPKLGITFPPAQPASTPAAGADSSPHAAGVSLAASSKRCSNTKLKQLGWTPRFPSYKEGYGALLA